MASVWDELKRRNVVRVGLAYAIVAWLILQLSDILAPMLSLPEWIGKMVFFILLIGFPLALIFAWAFELTPKGLKREKNVDRDQSITNVTGRKLDMIIIAVLAVAVAFFSFDKFVLGSKTPITATGTLQPVAELVQQSIAVLPFVNMSSDPEQEYFSDGLSEEILNLLAKIPDLKVIGRTSSFAFKGKNQDLRAIGEALGARTVLEGSVRNSGERVRITAQLIDTSDGTHLWSEAYDRTITDIFAVQDDVAAAIIDALQIHVGAAPTRGQPTANPDAYALFLKSRIATNAADLGESERLLVAAVSLDPTFAEAYELLAYSYWSLAGWRYTGAEGQRLMGDTAAKALAIDPALTFARVLYESGYPETWSWVGEISGLERVLEEQPGHLPALEALSYNLIEGGYFAESLQYSRRAVEIDPLSNAARIRLYENLLALGRDDEASAELEIALELGSRRAVEHMTGIDIDEGRIELAFDRVETRFQGYGYADTSWVRDLLVEGRKPDTGQAYLDQRIPEIVAMHDEYEHMARQSLVNYYLLFGFLDRYIDIILESNASSQSWTEVDNLIFFGSTERNSGFTAHPKYLEVAKKQELMDLWELRGAPDFCNKVSGNWICE
jgi:TolB-like protein